MYFENSGLSALSRRRRTYDIHPFPGTQAAEFLGAAPGKTRKNPENTSFSGFQVAAEGFEPTSVLLTQTATDTQGGHPGGQFGSESESVASLRQQALADLQRAWKSVRRMETLSDDPAESSVAERALAFVDKAFAELERKR